MEEQIIEAIIQRIKDEEKKHSKSIEDWYRIAANKIYATFDIKIKALKKQQMGKEQQKQHLIDMIKDAEDLGLYNKQSSIEWLYKELLNSEPNILEWNKLLEQAKERHKQEIVDAYSDGAKGGANDGKGQHKDGWVSIQMKEKYYKEHFGK